MTPQRTLTIASLLSILLFSLHWADEIARGIEPGTIDRTWGGLLILFIWLYGTLAMAERRWGVVILLLGSLLASGVPVLHMQGRGLVGGRIAADPRGAFFWVWTNIALGASGTVSLALSIRALWNLRARCGPLPPVLWPSPSTPAPGTPPVTPRGEVASISCWHGSTSTGRGGNP